MATTPKNLGKAWTRVVLYDGLPNLLVDPSKLRKSYLLVLGFQSATTIQKDSFGTTFLAVQGDNPGTYQSACAIPTPTFEPINNFMYDTSGTEESNNAYWSQMGNGASGIPPVFKQLLLPKAEKVSYSTELPSGLPPQQWGDEEKNIQTFEYNEESYNESGLGFNSASYNGIGIIQTPDDETTTAVVSTPKTIRFIHQHQSETWWGAQTKNAIKASGVPFWVTIDPTAGYTPDDVDKSKTSYLGILLARDGNSQEYVFVIDNRGNAFLTYRYGVPPKEDEVDDRKTRRVPVALPSLSRLFQQGNQFTVGFLIACGRLCVYMSPNEYDFVNIWGDNLKDIQRGFNLNVVNMEVYGYGCSAYVNVSPMTFYRKSWYVIPDMDGNIHYTGYLHPSSDEGPMKAGTLASGPLITWAIPQAQYDSAGGQQMYAGQFEYYREIDSVEHSLYPNDTELSAGSYNKQNNARNWWGRIYITRRNPVNYISKDKFWVCYMETTNPTGNGVTNVGSGFPILYNLFAKNPDDSSKRTYPIEQYGSREITDFVMNVQINEELDSAKPSAILKKASLTIYDREDDFDYNIYLTRARGIKIWLRWSDDKYNPISTDDDPDFVGVAFGETSTMKPGIDTVTLNCFDYWKVLERMKIKNSPFYDGFELYSVIEDLASRTGISTYNNIDHYYIPFHYLGSGFAFDKPAHRYEAQLSIKDCLYKAINAWPYYMYFDSTGTLVVSIVPGDFDWSKNTLGWDSGIYKTYYRQFNDAIDSDHPEKLIIDEVSMTSTLSDSLYNSFIVQGVNRSNNAVIITTGRNIDSLITPDSVGYLGFVSELEIQQPALDSVSAVSYFMDRIMKMFATPGFETTITTIGHKPNYRCGQFIKIKHNQSVPSSSMKYRVTAISHAYDAESNDWLTKITAYQITPGRLNFEVEIPEE